MFRIVIVILIYHHHTPVDHIKLLGLQQSSNVFSVRYECPSCVLIKDRTVDNVQNCIVTVYCRLEV
jgi:hypothetical protein